MATSLTRNFASNYMELCKQQRLRPLPVICITLPHSLDFTTDRVKMDDWNPILNALSLDRDLKSISIKSRCQYRKPLEEANSEDKARYGKAPVVLTRYLLEWLSHSVGQCVRNSGNLTSLELEGIPFPTDCLAVLCVGLASTETLKHLSLQRSYIGDAGCELLCRTIADVQSIRSLNLAHCNLTSKCGPALAAALSKQKLSLYHDAWKLSLRYREPNLETMPGLRRLTLNDNASLGDAAVKDLIEAVRDNLWIKALDLQRCGLTESIGSEILELLEQNKTLVVLDVRENPSLNEDFVREVQAKLEENNASCKSEYRWLSLPQKDRRVTSANCKKSPYEETVRLPVRPKSALAGQSGQARKSSQTGLLRKNYAATSDIGKRIKPRAPLPSPRVQYRRAVTSKNKLEHRSLKQENLAQNSKAQLHLDLQAQIRSMLHDSAKEQKKHLLTARSVRHVKENPGSAKATAAAAAAVSGNRKETEIGGSVTDTKRSIDNDTSKEVVVSKSEAIEDSPDARGNGFEESSPRVTGDAMNYESYEKYEEDEEEDEDEEEEEEEEVEEDNEDEEAAERTQKDMNGPTSSGGGKSEEVTKQLSGSEVEYERVLAEFNRKSVLLAKERDRRESAETQLKSMQKSLEVQKLKDEAPEREEMIQVLKQLVEAKVEQERLLTEAKRADRLLSEEKARREAAEAQLEMMRSNLKVLENALRKKERETEDSLLVSRHSLDEICVSFNRLFQMLDNLTLNPGRNENFRDNAATRADIERRVMYLIRKTKSENLKRNYSMIDDEDYEESMRYAMDAARKFAYSESDVRQSHAPDSPIRLERNIGDSPDVISPEARNATAYSRQKEFMTAGDRARAIFAQFVNGDTLLGLGSHVG